MCEVTTNSSDGVKVTGRFRPFIRRSHYKISGACGEHQIGSNTNLTALSGSTHNLLDSSKMMSMQEDARSRKISSEVMKRCLYKNTMAPCRRRIQNRMSYSNSSTSSHTNGSAYVGNLYSRRMMLSLPVTPMQSLRVSPSGSPTEDKHFFYGFLSHNPTPRSTTPVPMDDNDDEDDEDDCKGLASLFRPQPRQVMARAWSQQNCDELGDDGSERNGSEGNHCLSIDGCQYPSRFRSQNSIIKRKIIINKAVTPI